MVHHTQVDESFVRGDAAQKTNGIALQAVLEATNEDESSQEETATPSEEELPAAMELRRPVATESEPPTAASPPPASP